MGTVTFTEIRKPCFLLAPGCLWDLYYPPLGRKTFVIFCDRANFNLLVAAGVANPAVYLTMTGL